MRFGILTLMALTATMTWGTQLTPEQALSRFKSSNNAAAKAKGLNSSLKLAYTAEKEGLNAFYVYNSGTDGGYVILSADDCAPALLGYTDSGTFDMANIPTNMKAWLDGYAQQIAAASKAKATNLGASSFTADSIRPLLTTKWNQDSPFNDLCPLLDGKRAVSGCVATAMAQVMKYHKWPAQATGEVNYTFKYGANQTYTVVDDLSNYTFDWENMANIYDGKTTEAQNKAVAELMLACGESVQMEYSTDGSGAYDIGYCIPAFLNNFNYDKGAYIAFRTCYTCEEWDSLVYNELKNKRPVLFGGLHTGEDDGHQFVCDGYDGAGRFHINWGWAGKSDGYFLLTVLDPDSHGIGGNPGSNYSIDCNAFFGVKPAVEDAESETVINWLADGFYMRNLEDGSTISESLERNDKFEVVSTTFHYLDFNCYTAETMTMTPGLLVYYPNGDSCFVKCEEGAREYSYNDKFSNFTINGSDMPEGDSLLVAPAVMGTDGTVTRMKIPLYSDPVLCLCVTEDSIHFSESKEYMSSLECKFVGDPDAVIINSTNHFGLEITNKGGAEYNYLISGCLAVSDEDGSLINISKAKTNLVVVPAYSTINVDYSEEFSVDSTVNLSDYDKFYLAVRDGRDNIISDTISLSYVADANEILVTTFEANTDENDYVAWEDLTLTVEFTDGMPNQNLTVLAYIQDTYTEQFVDTIQVALTFDSEGECADNWKVASLSGNELADGEYKVVLRYINHTDFNYAENVSREVAFELNEGAAGISEISTDGIEPKIYSIDGRCVGTNSKSLPSGVYIINGKKMVIN